MEVEGFGDGGDFGPCLSRDVNFSSIGVQEVKCVLMCEMSYPMSLANVVATGVQPHICVSMFRTVPLTVIQHALQHIRDGAVVTAAITRCQHHNVAILGRACISAHALRMLGDAKVPLWLAFEITGLWRVVVGNNGRDGFGRRIVAVVLDRDVAVEAEEDDEDCDGRNGKYYASA